MCFAVVHELAVPEAFVVEVQERTSFPVAVLGERCVHCLRIDVIWAESAVIETIEVRLAQPYLAE